MTELNHVWSFPRDHWVHRGDHMEWWYFTGHLRRVDDPQCRFGYQFTILRIAAPERSGLVSERAGTDLFIGQAAVTDIALREHRFVDYMNREIPLLVEFHDPQEEMIAHSLAPCGTGGLWVLRRNGEGFDFAVEDEEHAMALRFTTRPQKPLILQTPNGLIRKGNAAPSASQYYSFTRVSTTGTLTLDNRTLSVRGTSWMDREFGSTQVWDEQICWDWFGLQLNRDRELMLYHLRSKDGTADYRYGTLVRGDGIPRYLLPGEWSIKTMDSWTSPATNAVYPMRWFVEVPVEGLYLDIVPEFAEQENCGRIELSPCYWEGAVRVLGPGGKPTGRGYVELMGYAENSRPTT